MEHAIIIKWTEKLSRNENQDSILGIIIVECYAGKPHTFDVYSLYDASLSEIECGQCNSYFNFNKFRYTFRYVEKCFISGS